MEDVLKRKAEFTHEELDRIAYLVDMGLFTDGSHHKQWCLWEIAKVMKLNIDEEDLWEDPIAP